MLAGLHAAEWFFFGYYAILHLIYFLLFGVALARRSRYLRHRRRPELPPVVSGLEPSISLLVPVYNEADHVVRAVRSLLEQRYPDYEVIVINDGSTDATLDLLAEAFALQPVPALPAIQLPHRPVRAAFRSRSYPKLLVIDKENGRKADAVNAGLCFATRRLVCEIDGDSWLEPDSLLRGVRPFLERPETIACGAALGMLNGLEIAPDGYIRRVHVTGNLWVALQTLEYIRAFMVFRLGMANLRAMPLISGAFGLYDREFLVEAGGYRRDTEGEDLEATLRFHRYARRRKLRYHIGFAPSVVCWTDVPATYGALSRQRSTWHRSLLECLAMNRGLPGAGGAPGWLLYPIFVIFEALAPLVLLLGVIYAVAALLLGALSPEAVFSVFVLVYGVGVLFSACALLLEPVIYETHNRLGSVMKLFFVALVENLGYRQIHAFWQLRGMVEWLRRPGTTLKTDLALHEAREKASP